MTTLTPRIVTPAQARVLNVLGTTYRIFVGHAESGGRTLFMENEMAAGDGVPAHVHTREDEVFYVLDGSIEFLVRDCMHVATAGITVFGPRNVPHAYKAVGGPARMLVSIVPSDIERMFKELAALPPGPPDMRRVAEIVGRFGISFV